MTLEQFIKKDYAYSEQSVSAATPEP